jgi:hypothetical protein
VIYPEPGHYVYIRSIDETGFVEAVTITAKGTELTVRLLNQGNQAGRWAEADIDDIVLKAAEGVVLS